MTTTNKIDPFEPVIKASQLKENTIYCTQINDIEIAVCNSKSNFYAVENNCTHATSRFDEGRVKGFFLICPLHGVMFDLRTGEPRGNLAKKALRTFETRINQQGFIEINIP